MCIARHVSVRDGTKQQGVLLVLVLEKIDPADSCVVILVVVVVCSHKDLVVGLHHTATVIDGPHDSASVLARGAAGMLLLDPNVECDIRQGNGSFETGSRAGASSCSTTTSRSRTTIEVVVLLVLGYSRSYH